MSLEPFPPSPATFATMLNSLPPRDTHPYVPQDNAGDALERDLDFADRRGDATGRDLPLSTSSSPTHRQGHALVNRSGSELILPSERETVSIPAESTGFTFHPTLSPPYDQGHVPLYYHHGDLPEGSRWGEHSHASAIQLSGEPTIFSYAPLQVRRAGDSDIYYSSRGSQDAPQLGPRSRTPLPPFQNNALPFSILGIPPAVIFNGDVFPPRYNENVRSCDHEYKPPTSFSSTPLSYVPHGDELPIEGTYPFESGQPPPVRAPNESPGGTVPFFPHPLEEGPIRYGGDAASFSTSLLTPHDELDSPSNQYESHHSSLAPEVGTENDAGPSRSWTIPSGDFPGDPQYPRRGKRKRDSEEVGGTTRSHPRMRKTAASDDSVRTQHPRQHVTRRRIKIEQLPYVCGNPQHHWVRQDSIKFLVNGQLGIRLTDALDSQFSGPDRRDDKMFQYAGAGSSISYRIHFPGHPAQSSQITTTDHRKTHNPRTRKQLAYEGAKCIKRCIEKLKIDMRCENVILTKLVHVSKASWQPEIWYEQELADES